MKKQQVFVFNLSDAIIDVETKEKNKPSEKRERIKNMTPEELEIFRAEQEEQMGMSA